MKLKRIKTETIYKNDNFLTTYTKKILNKNPYLTNFFGVQMFTYRFKSVIIYGGKINCYIYQYNSKEEKANGKNQANHGR